MRSYENKHYCFGPWLCTLLGIEISLSLGQVAGRHNVFLLLLSSCTKTIAGFSRSSKRTSVVHTTQTPALPCLETIMARLKYNLTHKGRNIPCNNTRHFLFNWSVLALKSEPEPARLAFGSLAVQILGLPIQIIL